MALSSTREGSTRLDVRKHFFSERVVKVLEEQAAREVVESLLLEVFKKRVYGALSDTVCGGHDQGLMVELVHLGGLHNSTKALPERHTEMQAQERAPEPGHQGLHMLETAGLSS